MPLHARKAYPKPWLQHTRGSDGERSPGSGDPKPNLVKLSVSPWFGRVRFRSPVFCPVSPVFFARFRPFFCLQMPVFPRFARFFFIPALEKTESTKVGSLFFSQHFSHHVWDFCLSELKFFGLLSLSLLLICWSQCFGYGFLACNGIIICTGPNILRTFL